MNANFIVVFAVGLYHVIMQIVLFKATRSVIREIIMLIYIWVIFNVVVYTVSKYLIIEIDNYCR